MHDEIQLFALFLVSRLLLLQREATNTLGEKLLAHLLHLNLFDGKAPSHEHLLRVEHLAVLAYAKR